MSTNFRSTDIGAHEPMVGFGAAVPPYHTAHGHVPALPPRPFQPQSMHPYGGMSPGGMYGQSSVFGGGLGAPSMYVSAPGYGSSMYGGGGFYGPSAMSAYGRPAFGQPAALGFDAEARFIQMAEESSRPAFQSIESLVSAIGNIAAMLDSTFFAITSSFRAILGVAANFGRLRSVFAQFWSTFALFRGLSWLYRKILFMLKLSNVDPSLVAMGEAFAAASSTMAGPSATALGGAMAAGGLSAWPIMVFLGFIFAGPYLIMKLIGSVSSAAIEESRNPATWVRPIRTQALHAFQATGPLELSIRPGQTVYIAPREVQQTHQLLQTGWLLASVDRQHSGIVPVNYVEQPGAATERAMAEAAGKSATLPGTIFTEATANGRDEAPAQPNDDRWPDDDDVKRTIPA